MPRKLILFLTLSLPVLCACNQNRPEIRAACEQDATGNYLIKWETFPPMEGIVKIHESVHPDSFNLQSPIAEQDIKTRFKKVPSMEASRRFYFNLVFNKKYSTITAERIIPTEGIYNLRDVGGYYNRDKHQTQWGMLYRSSSMSNATKKDTETLNNLGIKTLIDLRTEDETYNYPPKYQAQQIFNLPLQNINPFKFINIIVSEEMKKGDVLVKLQDIKMELLHRNTAQFIKIFDILLNEDNYPTVIYCSLGKDRTGIVISLILSALNVPYEQILQDYMLSNTQIRFKSLVPNAEQYSPEVQEALTTLFSTHEQVLNYLFDQIDKEYGSLNNYLEKELKLTPKKREKLKSLLLYTELE